MSKYASNTKGFFNDLATVYDDKLIKKYFKSNHTWIFENIPNLNGKKVLDIGCGTGELLIELEKKFPNGNFFGMDIAEGMLSKAKDKTIGKDNINFILGDVHSLPFKDEEFDIILNTISFHHYENPISVLKEVHRVLNNRGIFFLLDSLKDPFIISFMPWYWDYKDSKYCYSRHLYTKEFLEVFDNSNFKKYNHKKYFKLFPAVHMFITAYK